MPIHGGAPLSSSSLLSAYATKLYNDLKLLDRLKIVYPAFG